MTSRTGTAAIPIGPDRARLAKILAEGVLTHFAIAIVLVGVSVAVAVANVYVAYALAFAMTAGVTLLLPRLVPFLLLFAFLFQNLFIAFTANWVSDTELFDQMRAVNFMMVVAAFSCFALAVGTKPRQFPPALRPWLTACLLVMAAVAAYFVLGLALGNGKDAVIYLRNIVTPLAALYIALVCGARFRVELVPTLGVATLVIAGYGYCELFFTTDFLALFNGDRYIWLRMQDEVLSGVYARLLAETGFVLRGIEDYMTVPFFNITGADQDVMRIFRLSGPNFHPISYAYALALLSAWLFANRVRWVAILVLPLLIFVGSKGAIVLFLMYIGMSVGTRFLKPGTARLLFIAVLVSYGVGVLALGIRLADYHVLGLMAGLRDFLANPFGHGIGSGGVVSAAGAAVDWRAAQASGATGIAVESAIAVLLYQMGLAGLLFLALVLAVGQRCWTAYVAGREQVFLFGFVAMCTISVNAVFQEEAFFAPLALAAGLLLVGLPLGAFLSREQDAQVAPNRMGRSSS